MIYTTLDALESYRGVSRNLDTAIDWLHTADLAALPLGKTVIDGEKVFINVMEAVTRASADAEFEVHHRYADLQLDLTGQEGFEVMLAEGEPDGAFDEAADFGLLKGTAEAGGLLGGTRCVLFPAGEPHKPTLDAAAPAQPLKKAVVKIAVD